MSRPTCNGLWVVGRGQDVSSCVFCDSASQTTSSGERMGGSCNSPTGANPWLMTTPVDEIATAVSAVLERTKARQSWVQRLEDETHDDDEKIASPGKFTDRLPRDPTLP